MKTFKIDVTRIVEHIDHITIDVSANSLAEAKEAAITELEEAEDFDN